MALPSHFLLSDSGDLHDTRDPNWAASSLRNRYSFTFQQIDNVAQLKATLRNGRFAWPGGYPLFFITSDGAALSFQSVLDNLPEIMSSIRDDSNNGWRVIACDVNWEDTDLTDDHSGEMIESAYGE